MSILRQFISRIRSTAVCRAVRVRTLAMGRERLFEAYDLGEDTFVFERGIAAHLAEHPSVLIVTKRALGRRREGRVLTMTTGNHSVAALPLLDGRFWKISNLPSDQRSETLLHSIVCANVVRDTLEIAQRDVSTSDLVAADEWLLATQGFSLRDVVMGERNDQTLEYYRHLGQEWRIKPLAWTEDEMRVALTASRKRISTTLTYYHSMKGVHFLSFAEFARFAGLAQTDPEAFLLGLRELVCVYEGNDSSFTRQVKHRGHHEIEFFGITRGLALETLIPELEKLMEAVTLEQMGQLGIIQWTQDILARFRSLLTRPELADDTTPIFAETMYMYLTGEVYAVVGEGSSPAFDDRRTALPGATFVDGRIHLHPNADDRTEVLLANLRSMLSKEEVVEYANVYEIRENEGIPLGKGRTREVVYKTNLRPLEASLIEKGLSSARKGYSAYMLARIGALRSLGLNLSAYYRLLRQRAQTSGRMMDFYVRVRCEGESMETIPSNYFRRADGQNGEEREVVLELATLMGDAAAQNMVMKKYDPSTQTPLYNVGKEIYEFEYDLTREMVWPKKVATCSIRGSFGWPCLDQTDANLEAVGNFYLTHYARALRDFQRRHTVALEDLAERFMSGFEFRTHTLAWQLAVMRDRFETFEPDLLPSYGFKPKWRFVMWALDRQDRRLPLLRKLFFEKINEV